MSDNFVVSIPSDLKKIKAKLFFGLTKRQLIGFIVAIAISIPVYVFLSKVSTRDIAMYGLFFSSVPIIFVTIYSKDGMVAETWLKLLIDYKYISVPTRHYKISKRNQQLARERKILNGRKTKSISNSSKSS